MHKQLSDSFKRWRKENAPLGARVDVVTTGGLVDIEICCDGADSEMCYWCCLDPGHKGLCFSREKKVGFVPCTKTTFHPDIITVVCPD